MTDHEVLQWLLDNKAMFSFHKVKGVFCLKIAVKDPHGGKEHYTMFRFEDTDTIANYVEPAVIALQASISS